MVRTQQKCSNLYCKNYRTFKQIEQLPKLYDCIDCKKYFCKRCVVIEKYYSASTICKKCAKFCCICEHYFSKQNIAFSRNYIICKDCV